ncbi:hypothetical protein AYI68_g5637 [Smittium mucronatum]|uniref:Uncharacterized protein n=1 Tax=Smittium mucronatum TaxID=133383 RepID=A0A1R0GTR1_9FUNG|nr:hypothetical protein AYI68_g5637 [Smittium mucronatum]
MSPPMDKSSENDDKDLTLPSITRSPGIEFKRLNPTKSKSTMNLFFDIFSAPPIEFNEKNLFLDYERLF